MPYASRPRPWLFVVPIVLAAALSPPLAPAAAQGGDLPPPRDDAEALERGLRFSIPLAWDPDESVFWVEYMDAGRVPHYLPLAAYDAPVPALEDGMRLYPARDLGTRPVAIRVDPGVVAETERVEVVVRDFQRTLRDAIRERREGRRGPVSIAPDQAEALAREALSALAELTDTNALLEPLAQALAAMDGISSGRDLAVARGDATAPVIRAVYAERWTGVFVPEAQGVMRSRPPLPPPAARPWAQTVGLPVGPETTLVASPHHRDGTIDYASAFDVWRATRINPEDNAFVPLLPYFDGWGVFRADADAARRAVYDKLGVEPPAQAPATDMPPRGVWIEAMSRPGFYAPWVFVDPYLKPWFLVFPHTRYLWRILPEWHDRLTRRAQQAWDGGDVRDAIIDAAIAVALHRHVSDTPYGDYLFSWEPRRNAALLLQAAQAGHLDAEAWAQVRPMLDRQPGSPSFMLLHTRQARCQVLNALMQAAAGGYASAGLGDYPEDFLAGLVATRHPDPWRSRTDANMVRDERFDLERAMRRVNTYFSRLEQGWADQPLPDQDDALARSLAAHHDLIGSFLLGDGNATSHRWVDAFARLYDDRDSAAWTDHLTDMLIAMAIGHAKHLPVLVDRDRAARRALPALLAAHVYRQEHGGWPETLGDLMPGYLDAVPTDPFDGEPMRYGVEDGRPTVWSVGEDGIDDGGTGDDPVMPAPERPVP